MEQKKKMSMESVVRFMLNNKALILLIVLFIALSVISPYFLTVRNLLNVLRQTCGLAIMGIGDINEILGRAPGATPLPAPAVKPEEQDTPVKKLLRAIAIGLYILCPIPLFVLSGMWNMGIPGLCGTLTLVAVATVLIILGAKKETENADVEPGTPQSALVKSINGLIWAIGLAIYFIVSLLTGAWYITWVIFPITAAVQGLVKAILDLKEGK